MGNPAATGGAGRILQLLRRLGVLTLALKDLSRFHSSMLRRSAAQLLGRTRVTKGMTHALWIPLATPTSRPQWEHSLRRVVSDPSASAIHPAPFGPPDTQKVSIGTLSLQTFERMDKALRLLRRLDLDEILQKCEGNRSSSHKLGSPESQTARSSKNLIVTVSGIIDNRVQHDCRRLYAPIIDHTGKLSAFVHAIREKFLSADLLRYGDHEDPFMVPLSTKIIHNRHLKTKGLNTKPTIVSKLSNTDLVVYRLASFDVRAMFEKFQTMSWASNFALERLVLGSMYPSLIMRDGQIIGRGFEEVASVPLPGIEHLEKEPELRDVTYVKPKVQYL